ncbi:2977_t:CDS:2, partial [Scutellospora calospora]
KKRTIKQLYDKYGEVSARLGQKVERQLPRNFEAFAEYINVCPTDTKHGGHIIVLSCCPLPNLNINHYCNIDFSKLNVGSLRSSREHAVIKSPEKKFRDVKGRKVFLKEIQLVSPSVVRTIQEGGEISEDLKKAKYIFFPINNSENHGTADTGSHWTLFVFAGGKIVAFAARKVGEIPTGEGKYKYLPSYQYYQKSSLLYNYPVAKKSRSEECYLVEGFFDVISLAKLGVENCLALLGTNLSEEQTKLLAELKKRIILFLDSDKAGQEATINTA